MQQPTQKSLKSIFSKDVIILTLLGLALLVFSICRRDDAFPAASLDLKVNKKDAINLAIAYAETTGFDVPKKIISSSYFSSDSEAATFLEYQFPISEANALMRTEIPIWHWKVHLLDSKNNEAQVWIGVNGKLHSFERELNKELPAPSVSHEDAVALAEGYAAKELQIDLSKWRLIRDAQTVLPRRVDHSFTWENTIQDLNGGHLQLDAVVSGDKLSKFNYYLHVPDSFQQKFKWLRAQNRALANVSLIFIFLFGIWLPVIFLRKWTKGQLRIKFAVIGGLVAATVAFITNLNEAATIVAGTSNWTMDTFLAKHLLNGVSSALVAGLICTIFFGAIETVYRKAFPAQPSFELFFTQTSNVFRALSVAKSATLGFAVFGITTGYQVIFFLIGKHYGLWSPLAVHDRGIIDDFLPAWHAISIGAQASTLEELGFRIFMLAVIQRTCKSFWIANILQAAIWGFAHCTYAVEPPYARGIELTILGLFYGWMLRRYGVLCLILGHYAFDAYLSIQTLFGSHDALDWLSAFLTMAPVAVLPALSMVLIRKNGVVADTEVSNLSVTEKLIARAPTGLVQEDWPAYKPINRQQILIAIGFALLATIALMLPKRRLGNEPMLQVNHEQAIAIAKNFFTKEMFRVNDALAVAWLSDDTDTDQLQYIAKHVTFERAQQLEQLIEPRLVWNVRLFRPAAPNIFSLKIGPDGAPISPTISIDEMVPAAKLSQPEATEIAKKYLHSIESPGEGTYKLFDTSKHARPNRTDYTFTAEDAEAKAGAARFEVSFKLIGANISDVKRSWVLPDSTKAATKRGATSALEVFILVGRMLCALVVIPNIAYWIFCACKKQAPNRYMVSSAVIIAGTLTLLEQANYMSRFALWSYNPTEPMDAHLLSTAFGCLTHLAMDVSAAALLAAVVSASYPGRFASTRLRELFRSAKPQIANYRIWSDGILIGFTAALVSAGLMSMNEYVISQVSKSVLITRIQHLTWLEQSSLTMTTVLDAIKYGLLFVLGGAAILRWADFYAHDRDTAPGTKPKKGSAYLVPLLIAWSITAINLSATDPQRAYCNIGANLGLAASLYVVLALLGNANLVACFFTAFFLTVGKDLYYVQRHAAFIHPVDLMALYGLLIAPFLWLLLCLFMEWKNEKQPEQLSDPQPNNDSEPSSNPPPNDDSEPSSNPQPNNDSEPSSDPLPEQQSRLSSSSE